MRKIINIIISLVILLSAFFIGKYIIGSQKKNIPKSSLIVQKVFVDTVLNKTIPVVMTANGNLVALKKMELYAEVQGVLQSTGKLFREGQRYNAGEALLKLDASEFYASVQSQKSSFYNLIASVMPDLMLDYPQFSGKWQTYLTNFDIDKSVPKLPEITSDQERLFLAGRNVISTYYNVKNLEERLSKYILRAPFTGVLTETLVTEGTLVRSGQKLGEFIDPGVYELGVSVNKSFAEFLKINEVVRLHNINKTQVFEGKLVRINPRVDLNSQTIKVFISVVGETLKEGLYLEASIKGEDIENVIELPRSLLRDDKQLFVVRDSILDLIEVTPVYFGDQRVIIKGVPDGTKILSKSIPGAYAGMLVQILEE